MSDELYYVRLRDPGSYYRKPEREGLYLGSTRAQDDPKEIWTKDPSLADRFTYEQAQRETRGPLSGLVDLVPAREVCVEDEPSPEGGVPEPKALQQ